MSGIGNKTSNRTPPPQSQTVSTSYHRHCAVEGFWIFWNDGNTMKRHAPHIYTTSYSSLAPVYDVHSWFDGAATPIRWMSTLSVREPWMWVHQQPHCWRWDRETRWGLRCRKSINIGHIQCVSNVMKLTVLVSNRHHTWTMFHYTSKTCHNAWRCIWFA